MCKLLDSANMRQSSTQFPSFVELQSILSQGSQRPVLKTDNFNLEAIEKLYSLFELENNFHKISKVSEFLQWSENSKLKLIEKIQSSLNYSGDIIKDLNNAYDYLSEEDTILNPSSVDTIFVFGSSSLFRIQKAIELFKQGIGKTITISGHKPFYKDSELCEAEVLDNYAIGKGVPKESIMLEKLSVTLSDNVKRTLDLWDSINFSPTTIIIVCSPFTMRRAYTEWIKFSSDKIKIMRQNSQISDSYNRENWYKSSQCLNIILNEYYKLNGENLIDISMANLGYID